MRCRITTCVQIPSITETSRKDTSLKFFVSDLYYNVFYLHILILSTKDGCLLLLPYLTYLLLSAGVKGVKRMRRSPALIQRK